MLVRADADVAAVPGRRGKAGGREGAGWLLLKAVTPTGPLRPEEAEAEAPGS